MKKIFFLLVLSLHTINGWAQVGVGTDSPNSESVLEVASNTKGVLFPKVSLQASTTFLNGVTAVSSHTGMLVYNTNADTSTGLVGQGYYFWNGSEWERFLGAINGGTSGQILSATSTGITWTDPPADNDNQVASEVPFTAAGNIVATDLQASIEELDAEKHPLLPQGGSVFSVWAEENGDLSSSAYEWSFGNGNETPAGMGVILVFPCELIGLGLTTKSNSSVSVEAYKNSSGTGKLVQTSSSTSGTSSFVNSPVQYAAGDIINFRTSSGGSAGGGAVVVAWFRITG